MRIRFLLNKIIPEGMLMEDDRNPSWFLPNSAISIPRSKKGWIKAHLKWLKNPGNGLILYTEGSRNLNDSSGCFISDRTNYKQARLKGSCNIG